MEYQFSNSNIVADTHTNWQLFIENLGNKQLKYEILQVTDTVPKQ